MLHHKIYGQGERVIVGIHGWNGSHQTFAPLEPFLPADTRLIAVDLPGYGRSTSPTHWTLDSIADAILSTIESLAPGRSFTLLGSCSGAVVGLFVGRHGAGRVDHFVILEPFAYVPLYLRIFVFPFFGRLFYWSTFANPLGRWLTNTVLAGKRRDDTDMMASFSQGSPWVPHRYLFLFDQIPGAHAFEDLTMPKTLILGEHTFAAVRDSVSHWSNVWGHCRVEEVADAGHLILDEAPEAVAGLLFHGDRTAPISP